MNEKIEQIHDHEQELAISQERKDVAESAIKRTERETAHYSQQLTEINKQKNQNEEETNKIKLQLSEIDQHLDKQEEKTKLIEISFQKIKEQTDKLQQQKITGLGLKNDCKVNLERLQAEQTALGQNQKNIEIESDTLSDELRHATRELDVFEKKTEINHTAIHKLNLRRHEISELENRISQHISILAIQQSDINNELASKKLVVKH